ncbi:hypothetical protein Tco_0626029 [Tanacetum coccineum]|uniref:Uncharacterized protein n=1 Tax=Tanacetum coccineum TaxID=301880 RepID=A0ABQ4WIF2_9ASTR
MHATTTPPFQPVQGLSAAKPPSCRWAVGRGCCASHPAAPCGCRSILGPKDWLALGSLLRAFGEQIVLVWACVALSLQLGTWLRYMLVAWMGWNADIEGCGLGELCTYDKIQDGDDRAWGTVKNAQSLVNVSKLDHFIGYGSMAVKPLPKNITSATPATTQDAIRQLIAGITAALEAQAAAMANLDNPNRNTGLY